MRPDKTLIIHAGGGKTGTSSLQNFLAGHQRELASFGFSYRNFDVISNGFDITSGNGLHLLSALNNEHISPSEIDHCIGSYFGELDKAIVSTEMFEHLSVKTWQLLMSRCTAMGIRSEVVFFVRNVIPFFLSGYDQAVKRHGEFRSIDESIKSFPWLHYETLKRISTLGEELPVKAFSYEAERKQLAKCFLGAIGIETVFDETSNEIAHRRVNRSLTLHERDCLRLVNSVFGDSYSQDLSDRFIYECPDLQAEPEVLSDSAIAYLRANYQDAVDWINEAYFSGASTVAVHSAEEAPGPDRDSSAGFQAKVDQIFRTWLLEKLADKHQSAMSIVCNRLQNIDWDRAGSSLLPADFDPFAYLIKNPDVMNRNAPPYEHYLEYGRLEGREYSWLTGAFGI